MIDGQPQMRPSVALPPQADPGPTVLLLALSSPLPGVDTGCSGILHLGVPAAARQQPHEQLHLGHQQPQHARLRADTSESVDLDQLQSEGH